MARTTTETRRRLRTRRSLKTRVDNERMVLSIFRSSRYIYAQIIDPRGGMTLAAVNSRQLGGEGNKVEQARATGRALAERARAAGVRRVIFDRGSYRYHGRVAALAEGAREGGLEF